MSEISIDLTSQITQDNDTETFHKSSSGTLEEAENILRISYLEDNQIPVKLLIKDHELLLRRGVDHNNYSFMRLVPGEKAACRYLVDGRQMDLLSVTNRLELTETEDGSRKLQVEYDLFSGLYLVGNYAITLIFT